MTTSKGPILQPEMVEFRSFTAEDQAKLWELHNLTMQKAGISGGEGPWDDDLNQIIELYHENQGEFLVGYWQGQLIAMGGLYKTGPGRAEIKRMRVHPGFQGSGVGGLLLDKLERRAVELGYRVLHLDTPVDQLPANKLYLKKGYRETHRGVIASMDTIFYEKRISEVG